MQPDFSPRRTETGEIDTGFYIQRARELRNHDTRRWAGATMKALIRVLRLPR